MADRVVGEFPDRTLCPRNVIDPGRALAEEVHIEGEPDQSRTGVEIELLHEA